MKVRETGDLIPADVAGRLTRLVVIPAYVENARPHFPIRDYWRTVDDSRFWTMIVSQVCVVGSSAGWERLMDSGDADDAISLAVLLQHEEDARARAIHEVLRRHGVRYVPKEVGGCRKTTALLENLEFLTLIPGRSAAYLGALAGLVDDRARVRRVSSDLAYIKHKGARDLLIGLGLGTTLIAFDVRVLNVLKAAGANLPSDVQTNPRRYEELQTAVIEGICRRAGLSGAEFDRIVYRNYGALMNDLGRPVVP